MMKNKELLIIKSLVGESVTKENLALVDSFVYEKLSIFMPVGGNCGYAISPKHTHPSYMFVLAYDCETVVYVVDKKYETKPNTVFCLSPNIEHHEVQNYLPPKYSAIFIDKEFFEKSISIYVDESICLNSLVVDANAKLERLLKEFMSEAISSHKSRYITLENLASLITHELIRIVLKHNSSPIDVSENQVINKVVRYINAYYENDISVENLATISKLSKSHFSKLFTESMKVSPMEYLKRVRLQNAKKMLLSNQLSMTTIASQCGFNSPSYFSKIFKETFNESPKEFASRNNR